MCFKCLSRNTKRKECDINRVITSKVDITRTMSTVCSSRRFSRNAASLQDFLGNNDVEYLAARDSGLQIFEINDFVFGEEVGRGTNSKVRLLVRAADGVKFAGKMLQQGSWWSLINEASLMSKLSGMCANIASVEGIIVNSKCVVLPYYRNGDLGTALVRDEEKVKNGSASEFPFLRRLKYIWDACKAVTFLHKSSICHRDLAMRNLLLSDNMEYVLLTDFTLSRFVKGMNNQHASFRAEVPMQSAPGTFKKFPLSDQDIGGWQYSLKTDIWGLGITMFEIITKKNFGPLQKMPTKLPQSSLPPKHLFNKGWDLWFAIRCCWNTEHEKRPWSWEVMDKIKEIMENPVGGKTRNGHYYSRWSPREMVSASTYSSMNCLPTNYTMKEFKSQTTSEMDFSDCVTDRPYHGNSESILINPNLNVVTKNSVENFQNNSSLLERFWNSTRTDSSRCELPRVFFDNYIPSRSSPSCNTVPQKLSLLNPKNHVTNVAYCKDQQSFDDKKMIDKQKLSLNRKLLTHELTDIAYCGDRHFFDEQIMANQPEVFTSRSFPEDFHSKPKSGTNPVTGGSAYNRTEILEETQGSIHSETISEPSVPKSHFETASSKGIAIIL